MPDRFFSASPIEGDALILRGDEAKHLARVRRIGLGQTVELFDGSGAVRLAKVARIDRDTVSLEPIESPRREQPPGFSITLASAVPKGDRFDWLVEKAVEIGVVRLIPLIWTRSAVIPGASKLDRLRRHVIEASKQCGRNRIMTLEQPAAWGVLCRSELPNARFFADPGGPPAREVFGETTGAEAIVAVGPEGGLTDEERELATARAWTQVGLGPTILRIETAGLIASSLLNAFRRET